MDVRRHEDPEKLGWVRQDLLKIVFVNWPELSDALVLHGVSGDTLTDKEKKELRRKNINHVANIGTQPVAPLGGGTNFAGGSVCCRVWADKLVDEIELHEEYFYSQPAELRTGLADKGINFSGDMEFQLVPLDSFDQPDKLIEQLEEENCLNRELSQIGFVVAEAKSQTPIIVTVRDEQ